MAQVDFAERQITLKVVYWGPPHSGKTTNLRSLHSRAEASGRGRLMTIDTKDDRTVFFDLLPLFFKHSGFSFRLKVYTVPGQPQHEATRRIVLSAADGVVFVADSRAGQHPENLQSWQNLHRHLLAASLRVPIVVQHNKRDLPEALPWDQIVFLDHDSLSAPCPRLPASAARGEGVIETFGSVAELIWQKLDAELRLAQKYNIGNADFREAVFATFGANT